jgi:hypothetical protein
MAEVGLSLIDNSVARSSFGVDAMTAREFEIHFRACILATFLSVAGITRCPPCPSPHYR